MRNDWNRLDLVGGGPHRCAALDVLERKQVTSAAVLNRAKGWKLLAIQAAQQISDRLNQELAGRAQIAQPHNRQTGGIRI